MKRLLTRGNFLFLFLLSLILYFPSQVGEENPLAFIIAISVIEGCYLFFYFKKNDQSTTDADVVSLIYLSLGAWEVIAKLGISHPVLVPSPERVFYVFIDLWQDMLSGLFSSLNLLLWGVNLALILGISFGLFVGYLNRLRKAIIPIVRVISPIPPLVYTPYVVAVMPTFKIASIFIIFSAVFWPTFLHMIRRVGSVDRKIIDSAKSMDVSTSTMLFKVILPYTLPDIIGSLGTSVTSAMMCLTGAELLGASSGLGYFVRKYSDFADYTKVIAGIIFIGIFVTILFSIIRWIERKTIKWSY
ncbi:ABC transporter permease [Enterococcus olivae]